MVEKGNDVLNLHNADGCQLPNQDTIDWFVGVLGSMKKDLDVRYVRQ